MSVIIKALLKSLVEKKARTFLVLFSIAVSAAMIFANESFSRTVTERLYEADTRRAGNSDLVIDTKEAVGAKEWIDLAKLAPYQDLFTYAFAFIQEKALYMPSLEKMQYFNLIGADIDQFNEHNPVILSEGSFADWTGNKIIIGRTMANLYGLKLGDTLKLELNNTEYKFKIAGISEVKGQFLRELADGGFILAPKETISKIFGGDSNLVFLKLKDPAQKAAVKEQLTQAFADYNVQFGINDAVIATETQNYVMPFQMSSIVVMVMCMFIIFTAFNVVTLERIPIVGTLRSIGCTRKLINAILVVESAGLGVIGGLFGCVLGVLVLQYIKYRFFTGEEGITNSTISFGPKEVLVAVGAAVIITTLSAILPIVRLTRTPIKNIILNDLGKKQGRKSLWWVPGLVLLAACLVVPRFLPSSFPGMIVASLLATGAIVGLVPVVPFVTEHLARLLAKIPFLSQEVVLGVRNVRDNASLVNNIQLFSASVAIVAFMASMFNTMGADLLKAWERDTKYDIQLTLRHSNPESIAAINKVAGVDSSVGINMTFASVQNYGIPLNGLLGLENADYFQFSPVGDLDKNQEALAHLNSGKNIITTNIMKSKLGLKLGDTLQLQFNGKTIPYTITGFIETNWGIGQVGYISAQNYRADMGVSDYDFIYVKTKPGADPDQVKNNILRAMTKEVMKIQTKKELMASNADKVISVFNAINSYCYLALLVGIIGIVNNLVASFIERKRSFAMFRCVGMSKKGLNRMLVTEAVAMGIFGAGFGILCTLVMSSAIPAAVSVLWGKVTVELAVKEMIIIGSVGILAMLAISIVPVTRSEKMSLIETIKYE